MPHAYYLPSDSSMDRHCHPCRSIALNCTPTRRHNWGGIISNLLRITMISHTHQTPVWNQPEPGPVGLDNTDADIGDDDDEPELTIHEREHHELRWPEETRLVHPPRGRWSLRVQNRSVKAVIQDAFPLAQRYVASVDAFPSPREKVRVGRDVLYRAAMEGTFDTIADRLSRDRWYGLWLSPLVRSTRYLASDQSSQCATG